MSTALQLSGGLTSRGSTSRHAPLRSSPVPPPRAGLTHRILPLALAGLIGIGCLAGGPARADGGPVLQLGLFQKDGDAWWTWTSLQRRAPALAASLTPDVKASEEQDGVVLRAAVAPGVDARSLCRRLTGAGFSCLVVKQRRPEATESARKEPAPAAPSETAMAATDPAAAPEPARAVESAVALPPAGAPLTVTVPAPPGAVRPNLQASQGTYSYSKDDAQVMKAIERTSQHKGRLGSVVIDVKFDITPATLQREGWRLCALTFDDGPHRVVTRKILDVLNAEGVRATYFPVASVAAAQGEVIRDFIAAGHEIGNHSLTHKDMRAMDAEAQRHEIAEANRILRGFGAEPVLFRPPFGRYTPEMLSIAREERMSPVLWNIDTRDWQVRDPDKIVQHVKTAAGTGSVLLMHSTYPSTLTALPRVIGDLRAKGCEFVTLSEWVARMERLAPPPEEPQLVKAEAAALPSGAPGAALAAKP
ncbi:polysaccharide deacetylase family protein [Azospirillum sp. SYSU D00513]|uniref:polysaccharide deacetylase family protein n=1 Tax=Azospirillum sp. SYSU D00513 TaxID=2812561 RepID=UPI001FFF48F7|nr:polysaccharide deacetylase family protein [Azospirillum sp. SYSU D00513]